LLYFPSETMSQGLWHHWVAVEMFHRGVQPQVGNLEEEVQTLGKTKLAWIKMGSIWKQRFRKQTR
jgi:hypothetical protein